MKRKYLYLLIVVLVVALAITLVACGNKDNNGGGGNNNNGRTLQRVDITVGSSASYTFNAQTDTFTIGKDVDVNTAITSGNFTVKGIYSDGTDEVLTDFTVSITDNGAQAHYRYVINVTYGNYYQTYTVFVESDALPSFTNVRTDVPEASGYYIDANLTYSGETYNILPLVTTDEDGVTLQTLVDQHKVRIVVNENNVGETTSAVNANNEQLLLYYFEVHAEDGYAWKESGEDVTVKQMYWKIGKKVLATPTLTSATTFEYKHSLQTVNGNPTYVGVEQGLTFNLGKAEGKIEPIQKYVTAGTYYTTISLTEEASANYTFVLGDGSKSSSLQQIEWSITKMLVPKPTLAYDTNKGEYIDEFGAVHYTYTGQNIRPTFAVAQGFEGFFQPQYTYDESINADTYALNANTPNVRQEDIYNYRFEDSDLCILGLSYVVDKAACPQTIVAGLANTTITLEREFNDYNNQYGYYVLTLTANDFVQSTLDAFEALGMLARAPQSYADHYTFDFALPNGANAETALAVNDAGYPVKVTYTYGYVNYEPITFTATLRLQKVGWEVNTSSWYTCAVETWNVIPDTVYYDPSTSYKFISGDNNFADNITYTVEYGADKAHLATITTNADFAHNEIKNAGAYRITAVLDCDGNHFFYAKEDVDKTPITSFVYRNTGKLEDQDIFVIEKKTIMPFYLTVDGTAAIQYGGSYYTGVEKTITVNLPNDDAANDYHNALIDLACATEYKDSGNYVPADTLVNVGEYRTTITFSVKPAYAQNYEIYEGSRTSVFDWNIFETTLYLVTGDPTCMWYNQVTYLTTDNEPYPYYYIEQKCFTVFYMFSTQANPGNEQSWAYSEPGDYRVRAQFYLNMLDGFDGVTVYVDGLTYVENGERIYRDNLGAETSRTDLTAEGGLLYARETADFSLEAPAAA